MIRALEEDRGTNPSPNCWDVFSRRMTRIERRLSELEEKQMNSMRSVEEEVDKLSAKLSSFGEETRARNDKIKRFLRNCVMCSEMKQYTGYIETKLEELRRLVAATQRSTEKEIHKSGCSECESLAAPAPLAEAGTGHCSTFKKHKRPNEEYEFVETKNMSGQIQRPHESNKSLPKAEKRAESNSTPKKPSSHGSRKTEGKSTPASREKRQLQLNLSAKKEKRTETEESREFHFGDSANRARLVDLAGEEELSSEIPRKLFGVATKTAPLPKLSFAGEGELLRDEPSPKNPSPANHLSYAHPQESKSHDAVKFAQPQEKKEQLLMDDQKSNAVSENRSTNKKKLKFSQIMQNNLTPRTPKPGTATTPSQDHDEVQRSKAFNTLEDSPTFGEYDDQLRKGTLVNFLPRENREQLAQERMRRKARVDSEKALSPSRTESPEKPCLCCLRTSTRPAVTPSRW